MANLTSDSNKNHKHHTSHIKQSLVVNACIAVAKGIAAFFTGSGAMLAETIHSVADCANQGLLLLGVKQSKKPADAAHPFGYGRSNYFWSFMVAMLLFSIGGMFSIYEGVHKYMHPEAIHNIAWGVGVLAFAILLEAYATLSNIKNINKTKGNKGFFKYLRTTKQIDVVVVFGENSAAVLGLVFAMAALLLSYYTGDARFDAIGSLLIGIILILVAIFLAIEAKSLLIGERADPNIEDSIINIINDTPEAEKLLSCKTIQQGPGEVLVCVRMAYQKKLTATDIANLNKQIQSKVKQANPDVKWLYIALNE